MKSFIFVTFLLASILLTSIRSQVLVDDNYVQYIDNNIPEPTLLQIQKQTIKIQAETTIPVYIQPPQMLFPLYYSHIQNKVNQNCSVEYLDEQKQYGDYIKFGKQQLGKFQGWPIEILDAAYVLKESTIYALLTNGSIIKSNINTSCSGQGRHIDNFQIYDYSQAETEDIWSMDEYELYSTGGSIYMLKEKKLFRAVFSPNNQWEMQTVQDAENINSVHRENDDLYIVKVNSVHKVNDGTISSNLLDVSKLKSQKMQFTAMDIDNGFMYVLCKAQGVLFINMANNYELISKYLFDFHDYASKINVKNNTALINFRLYRKIFIGEFFFIPSNVQSYSPTFKLNKFYYRFDEMSNVVLFQDFGVVYSLSELNFFQHSINRNVPFTELQTENIYRASYPKILDFIPLDEKNLHYILVQKNGIFVESLGNSETQSLLQSRIKCVFQQSGKYQVTVVYEGFCKQNKRPTESYCSKEQDFVFYVTDQKESRQVQALNDHMFVVLILAVIFVLVIGVILTYRRITHQNRQKLHALLAQKKKFQQMNSQKGASQKGASLKIN